jgi:RimJ/RimL family protein N-acetyltransferase
MGFTQMLLSVAGFNERARRSYDSLGFRVIGSHWDHQSGPDVTTDSRFRDLMHLFRRGSLGLETLFYDMALDKAVWEQTAHIYP